MSTPYAKLIVGCELPPDDTVSGGLQPVLVELRGACKNSRLPENEVGFHCTGDHHEDYLWWGVCCKTSKPGFHKVEDPESEPFKEAHSAWLKLPEEQRRLLGRPKVQLLVGID